MSRIIRMDRACCGCNVRSITIFLLYISFISIILSYAEYQTAAFKHRGKRPVVDFVLTIHDKLNLHSDHKQFGVAVSEIFTIAYKGLLSYELLTQTVSLFTIILCLYGVHARRAGFMIPHLVYIGLELILWTVLYLIALGATLYILMTEKGPIYAFFIVTFILVLIHGISIYLYLIIYNCYLQTKGSQRSPTTNGTVVIAETNNREDAPTTKVTDVA